MEESPLSWSISIIVSLSLRSHVLPLCVYVCCESS